MAIVSFDTEAANYLSENCHRVIHPFSEIGITRDKHGGTVNCIIGGQVGVLLQLVRGRSVKSLI